MLNKSIRVMLVDDHDLVLKSITELLRREKDIEVVATATNGLEAIGLAEVLSPDVIVMDVSMPELDGIRAANRIREVNPVPRIVMLSMHKDATLLQQAYNSGAVAYIGKEQAKSDLIPAIRDANAQRPLN